MLLNEAASKGDHFEVGRLISEGATFQCDGVLGMNPLHLAAMHGHLEVCKVLLQTNILVDIKNMVGKTALHLAAMNGHYEIVRLLIECKATVDACDMLEMTPLHWACDRGHSDIVYLLLRHGANPSHFNKFNKSPNYLAMERSNIRIVEIIKNYSRIKTYSKRRSHSTRAELEWPSKMNEFSSSMEKEQEQPIELGACSSSARTSNQLCSTISSQNLRESSGESDNVSPLKIEEIMLVTSDDDCDLDELEKEFDAKCRPTLEVDENSDNQDDLLRSLDELENASFNSDDLECFDGSAAELLRAQASLGSIEDPSQILKRAVRLGQTIMVTEAGKKAMSMIVPEPFVIPYEKESDRNEREESPDKPMEMECNTVALRTPSITDIFSELNESCQMRVRSSSRSPSSKRHRR